MRLLTAGLFLGMLCSTWCIGPAPAAAQQNPDGRLPIADSAEPLIWVLRDPVVQDEIQVDSAQRAELISLANEIDLLIWPARNQSAETAEQAWSDGTALAQRRARTLLRPAQLRRLDQIVLRIQGLRAARREDFANLVQLSPAQKSAIGDALDAAAAELNALREKAAAGEDTEPLEAQAAQIHQQARRTIEEELSAEQRRTWTTSLGEQFDLSVLGQITFAAPGLSGTGNDWLGEAVGSYADYPLTVVHFFASDCINCQHNYEHYLRWYEEFHAQGVAIVGIHTPETSAERDVARLQQKVREAGFEFPILVDNDQQNWNAWGNSMWPSVYLVDRNGRIRGWWYGELNWQGGNGEERMRQRISELLRSSAEEPQPAASAQ